MRSLKRFSFFALLATTAALLVSASNASAQQPQTTNRHRAVTETNSILYIIETEALDSVNMYTCAQQIQKSGISGCLDRHSRYLTAEERKSFLPNNYFGVGTRTQVDGKFLLLFPIPNAPASKAGILPGDTLVKIDSTELSFNAEITPEELQKIFAMIRGPENTVVRFSVLRGGKVVGPITVTRAKIEVNPVTTATVAPGIGYLGLDTFNENAAKRMTEALENFSRAGIKKLILDFRGNSGGLLYQAESIADLFSPGPGNLKVTMHYRTRPDQQSVTTARGPYADMKVMLLVDSGSASASEIVAGIFQDWKAATLVGTHTYGKGIGQTVFPLDTTINTPYLSITTFAFLVGNGKVKITPKTPLQPDVKVDNDLTPAEAAQLKAELRVRNPNTPYLNPKLDKQLAKAIELLK